MATSPGEWRGKRLHFMGVGGIGVSALAEFALAEGAAVSGCDRAENAQTARLRELGAEISIGHEPAHVANTDLLIYTSAIGADHPELAAAANKEKRGRFLARVMDGKEPIGVSGTHGKTTTTWILAHLLISAGLDPSVFLGGVSAQLGGNLRIGKGRFVAELDESDESFLAPRLSVALVTNVESDHLGHYGDDAAIVRAFERFVAGVENGGLFVAGVDDPGAAGLFSRAKGRKTSFGLAPDARVRAVDLTAGGGRQSFRLLGDGQDLGMFALSLPGEHNVKNALGALAVALELGVSPDELRRSLPLARSVERRMEYLGTLGRAALYSDYAHHPTEVRAAIAGARQLYPGGRIAVMFQPHLFSRTRDYAKDFAAALATADVAAVADIYPAREAPLPGVTSMLILEGLPGAMGPFPIADAFDVAGTLASKSDALILMGAGDIDGVARRLAE